MRHPYNTAGDIQLRNIIEKLKSNFVKEISIEVLQKLSIANKCETYVVNTLKFIKLFDETGMAVPENKAVFMKKGESFQLEFSEIIKKAYVALFDLHGDDSWNLDDDGLLSFFKVTDGVSDVTAKRQAQTFKVFAETSGKREAKSKATAQVKSSAPTKTNKPKQATPKSDAPKTAPITIPTEQAHLKPSGDFALSVRIEVNLPAGGTKQNYDDIFKSIRENLINE